MKNEVLLLNDQIMSAESCADVATAIVALESMTVVDFAVVPATSKKAGWKPHWGTWPQWIAAMCTLVLCTIGVITFVDSHIDKKFAPLDDKFKSIDKKFDDVQAKFDSTHHDLTELTGRVGNVEGWREGVEGKLKLQSREQERLNGQITKQDAIIRLYDPNRILATIRAEIQTAQADKRELPASDLIDYRNAVRALPSSSVGYWATVAAIINYQSLVNQLSGEAPDPTRVAKPCFDENSRYNTFENMPLRDCVIVLDTETFNRVTFQNSVIVYHGGPVVLNNVAFVNCRFVLDLPQQHEIPAEKNLLLALLDSPDQKKIQISK
jgi:hypothetical protein